MLLRFGALALLVTSGALLWWAFRVPPPLSLQHLSLRTGEPSSMPPRSAALRASVTRPLDDFVSLWRRRLGAPLHDPPPPKPIKRSRPAPTVRQRNKQDRLAMRLIGTVLESGQSQAIVADSKGNILVRGVGETLTMAVGSARVERIELHQVTLSLGDDTLTLKMQ